MALNLTPEQRQTFVDAIYGGRKIDAIKQFRAMSGLDLKESKEIIERLETELRTAHPERFSKAAMKSGCVGLLLLMPPAVILLWYIVRRAIP